MGDNQPVTDQPVHRPGPGASRATALRPDIVFRALVLVPVVVFVALTLQQVLRADPVGNPVPVVLDLALLGASTYAATRAWTTRVWVETSYPTGWVPGTAADPGRDATVAELLTDFPASRTCLVLESAGATGLRRREAPLEHPTTIALSGASYTGARPSWRLRLTTPAGAAQPARTLTIRAPWLTDLRPLLLHLRHVVAKDERLAADADTLAVVSGRRPLDEDR